MFFLHNWQWWDKFFSCGMHLYIRRLITSVPLPETLWDTLRHIETLWDTLRQLETTWDDLRHFETTWDNLRQLETLWDTAVGGEKRNHGLKYESDCVSIGIGIKIWIVEGFVRDCFVEFLSSTPQSNKKNLFQNKFYSRCVSYKNCKLPRRKYTPKRENCFAILISVCNFYISLQFSYQFAIVTFWCIVPMWTFAIFIWVCNFHISL